MIELLHRKRLPTVPHIPTEAELYSQILVTSRNSKKRRRKTRIELRDKIITGILAVVIMSFAVGSGYYYNALLQREYQLEADLAQIDTQLQRRKNLTINLGTAVGQYSRHERYIFTHLAELRTGGKGMNLEKLLQQLPAGALGSIGVKPADMGGDLAGLNAVAEQYPQLQLSENFRALMGAIQEYESELADLRRKYNSSVNEYSTMKDQFPGLIYAAIFSFGDHPYFEMDADAGRYTYAGAGLFTEPPTAELTAGSGQP